MSRAASAMGKTRDTFSITPAHVRATATVSASRSRAAAKCTSEDVPIAPSSAQRCQKEHEPVCVHRSSSVLGRLGQVEQPRLWKLLPAESLPYPRPHLGQRGGERLGGGAVGELELDRDQRRLVNRPEHPVAPDTAARASDRIAVESLPLPPVVIRYRVLDAHDHPARACHRYPLWILTTLMM